MRFAAGRSMVSHRFKKTRSLAKAFSNAVFITGTDTGVGKTVLTVAWLRYLASIGYHPMGLKPWCSGNREDVRRIQRASTPRIAVDLINPFFFERPVAPVASRLRGAMPRRSKSVSWEKKLLSIAAKLPKGQPLLVEGIGGLLVPISRSKLLVDFIVPMKCPVVIVAKNSLGTLNHTLLTVSELEKRGVQNFFVVLMAPERSDASTPSNARILANFLGKNRVFDFPRLGPWPALRPRRKKDQKNFKKTLARITAMTIVWPRCCDARCGVRRNQSNMAERSAKKSVARSSGSKQR